MPTLIAAQIRVQRMRLDGLVLDQPSERIVQCEVAAADAGGAGAAIGLQHVAVDDHLSFARARRMSHAARSDRPMRRWISTVRPLCLPFAASRSIRSGDAPGSIEYSAVTHPLPVFFIHLGTFSSIDAVHSTRVLPNVTRHTAGGHLGVVALEGDGTHLVARTAVEAGHMVYSLGRWQNCGRNAAIVIPVDASDRQHRAPGRAGARRDRANHEMSPLE